MKICIEYKDLVKIVGSEKADEILKFYLSKRRRRGRPHRDIDINKIYRLLEKYGNKSVVAKLLNISRPTLYKILKKHEKNIKN